MNTSILSNTENVSLFFLDGLHLMNHTLVISQVKKLFLTCLSTGSQVIIKCKGDSGCSGIKLESIKQLIISNLTILGDDGFLSLDDYGDKLGTWLELSAHTSLFNHLTVANIGLEIVGKSTLEYCKLDNSIVHVTCCRQETSALNSLTLLNSNLFHSRIMSGMLTTLNLCKQVVLSIVECIINRYHNRDNIYNAGLVVLYVGPAATLNVEIIGSWLDGNIVIIGVLESNNISVFIHDSNMTSHIDGTMTVKLEAEARNNNFSLQSTNNIFSSADWYGLSLEIPNDRLDDDVNRQLDIGAVVSIAITNCTFSNNKIGVGIMTESNFNVSLEMLITDSTFHSNKNAMRLRSLYTLTTVIQSASVLLRNCNFENNSPLLINSGVVRLVNINTLMIQDCRFTNNHGSAIESYYSSVTLAGNILFSNNTSIKGGAMFLYESQLHLNELSNSMFINNYAHDIGGAIYLKQNLLIDFIPYNSERLCFYQINTTNDSPELNLNFSSNLALNGGDDIYGGSLYGSCQYVVDSFYKYFSSSYLVDTIFNFHNKNISSVTSDPTRVCLCDDQGTPQCANMEYIYRELPPRYPGELFTVSAVVVDSDFGTVPGFVLSDLVGNQENSSIGQNQRVQEIKDIRKCSQLTYSIESHTTTTHSIQLNISENAKVGDQFSLLLDIKTYKTSKIISYQLINQPIQIHVHLKNCPVGFTFTTSPPFVCTCHPILTDNSITVCIIRNNTGWVYRSGTIWVSDSFTGNRTNCFVLHQHCPYGYCKPENISVDLKRPDTQCTYNHSGVLCGGCNGNLSLALGSPRCLPCNNNYVALFIGFVLAGFALVLFIKIMDLTVAKGTINGLILYANIVWANKSILLVDTESLHPVQYFLHLFIAWLNLDLGIETCFINDLDAYWKTWLQFLFPIYVWVIIGVVIITSHYSTRASKIFGNNSVPVLATLILLSYAKLLRTIITSLGFSLLDYPEGTRVVWSFDGNVPYFGAAHTILFLVAIVALLFLWLPYTAVLVTMQWLRRKSNLKPLRWINKWKPFIDAYFGQLKPNLQYWMGLLLLVRVFLLVVFAVLSAVAPRVNILVTAIVGLCLITHLALKGLMYKSLGLSLLESSFIMNLTLLAIIKLYIQPTDAANVPVVYTSIGAVFIQFMGIVIYHTWYRIRSNYLTYKRRQRQGDNTPQATDRELQVVAAAHQNLMHYREPLLESS